jgi:hypothetical protein
MPMGAHGPICQGCSWRHDNRTCVAFPRGIPPQILLSLADHRQPFLGDHGIRFAAVDAAAAAYAAERFPHGPLAPAGPRF